MQSTVFSFIIRIENEYNGWVRMKQKTYVVLKVLYILLMIALVIVLGRAILMGNKWYSIMLVLVLVGMTKDLWLFKKRVKE